APLPVPKIARNDQTALAADLHGRHALVPPPDDLPLPQGEGERLPAVNRAIELCSVGEPAGVVDDRRLAGPWRVAVPDALVDVAQAARGCHYLSVQLGDTGGIAVGLL